MKLFIFLLIAMTSLVSANWDDNRNLCKIKQPQCMNCCGAIKSCLENCAYAHTTEQCREQCASMMCIGDSGIACREICTPNFCSGRGEYEVDPIPEPGRV